MLLYYVNVDPFYVIKCEAEYRKDIYLFNWTDFNKKVTSNFKIENDKLQVLVFRAPLL